MAAGLAATTACAGAGVALAAAGAGAAAWGGTVFLGWVGKYVEWVVGRWRFVALFLLGLLLHRLIFRRLAATSPNADAMEARSLIVGFGLMFIAQNAAQLIWGGGMSGQPYLDEAVKFGEVTVAANRLLVLGVADWALAKKRHVDDLMMSHQEVKQEHKNAEGDPHQKAKQTSRRKQIANGGTARGVQKASAIVVNPSMSVNRAVAMTSSPPRRRAAGSRAPSVSRTVSA